jgi:hypothetical protein
MRSRFRFFGGGNIVVQRRLLHAILQRPESDPLTASGGAGNVSVLNENFLGGYDRSVASSTERAGL